MRPAPLVITTKLITTNMMKHHQADGEVAAHQDVAEGFD